MKRLVVAMCCLGLVLSGCGSEEAPKAVARAPRVACVGDSITQGFGGYSYCEVLAEEGDWVVGNFGVCGTTARTGGAPGYAETGAYRESMDWEADWVVLMLGTNDTAYWQGRDAFVADYLALVDAYLDAGCRVLLCTPPAPRADAWANDFGVRLEVFQEVCASVSAVAEARDLPLVDVYAESAGKDVTISDGIHPNAQGAALIARAVKQALEAEGLS